MTLQLVLNVFPYWAYVAGQDRTSFLLVVLHNNTGKSFKVSVQLEINYTLFSSLSTTNIKEKK